MSALDNFVIFHKDFNSKYDQKIAIRELIRLYEEIAGLEKAVGMANNIISTIEPKRFSVRFWLEHYGKEIE